MSVDIELRAASMNEIRRDTISVTGERDIVERVVDRLWASRLVDSFEGMARKGDLETWILTLEDGMLEKLAQAIRNNPPDEGQVEFLEM